jgi:hypothetical protein
MDSRNKWRAAVPECQTVGRSHQRLHLVSLFMTRIPRHSTSYHSVCQEMRQHRDSDVRSGKVGWKVVLAGDYLERRIADRAAGAGVFDCPQSYSDAHLNLLHRDSSTVEARKVPLAAPLSGAAMNIQAGRFCRVPLRGLWICNLLPGLRLDPCLVL